MRHKRVVRDTVGVFSSDWSKITFVFRKRSVARLWWSQRLVSLEKKMRNVFESIINVWLIRDPFVTYLTPIHYPSITHSLIHLRPICNNVWPTSDLSVGVSTQGYQLSEADLWLISQDHLFIFDQLFGSLMRRWWSTSKLQADHPHVDTPLDPSLT